MRTPPLVFTLLAGATLAGQAPLGEPRWMPVAPIAAPRRSPAALAMEKGLLDLVARVRALPVLSPPPGVYPSASLTFIPSDSAAPDAGVVMFGFWPPGMTAVTNGVLRPAGELLHLIVYVNTVRADAFDRTYWSDASGGLLPQPRQVGELQGFPIYEGFGGSEVSGILVVQPAGRSLFTPVSRERFHRFEVARLEKAMREAAPALKAAQEKYAALVSPAGRSAQEARLAASLEQYQKARPRTATQVADRDREIRRLEAEEEERLRVDATPEGHRLIGPLGARLASAKASLDALTPAERAEPACHAPGVPETDPHPVPPGTAACRPVVALSRWYDPALPKSTWQLLSVERYWPSKAAVSRGVPRDARNLPVHVNVEVTEALDWRALAATLK